MKDDTMNDMAPIDKKVTPLTVFQTELLKFKGNQNRKNFLTVFIPMLIIAIVIGGYFVYSYYKLQREKDVLNQSLANTIKMNEDILIKNQQEGTKVSGFLVTEANNKIEETKLGGKYGLSPEQIEKIKNSNQ
jgi:uncharacterized protein YuzE